MEKAKIIAHRGNVNGINIYFENTIEYIKSALDLGFDVEIDIHEYKEKLYTGHDEPQELLPFDILINPNCIFHAKTFQALTMLIQKNCHVFLMPKQLQLRKLLGQLINVKKKRFCLY